MSRSKCKVAVGHVDQAPLGGAAGCGGVTKLRAKRLTGLPKKQREEGFSWLRSCETDQMAVMLYESLQGSIEKFI